VAKIYTRTGDDGTTGVIGGKRVSKDSPWTNAGGSLDELSALIGVVRSNALPSRVDEVLQLVQSHLIVIGSEIAAPEGIARRGPQIRDEDVKALESEIDALENDLVPLKQFILPGGGRAAAELHLARAVARRAEREYVALSRMEKASPKVLCYLNRLSDLCFVLARWVNQNQNIPELLPLPSKPED